mmetsp:Transcript_108088/g.304466  ORF Transcript_108088/g.304466 Transcript_108088/m.304466 type:complete len:172 (-) Transcript_108088:50-565(-)
MALRDLTCRAVKTMGKRLPTNFKHDFQQSLEARIGLPLHATVIIVLVFSALSLFSFGQRLAALLFLPSGKVPQASRFRDCISTRVDQDRFMETMDKGISDDALAGILPLRLKDGQQAAVRVAACATTELMSVGAAAGCAIGLQHPQARWHRRAGAVGLHPEARLLRRTGAF